jgi:hypothetical protein
MRRLSKSKFQTGRQCCKALWLELHDPDSADPTSESAKWILDEGTEFGRRARGLFPGGVEVTDDHRHPDEAIASTQRLLDEGATVLYEPAFACDGVLVRVDILVAVGDGRWDLYEVKSASSLKPEHISDVAIQTYVVEGAGLPVRDSYLVHVNGSYVYEGGEHDLAGLLKAEDVTTRARVLMPSIHAELEAFQSMLDGSEPAIQIGPQCHNPHDCAFIGRCHAFLPDRHPITEIPNLESPASSISPTGSGCRRTNSKRSRSCSPVRPVSTSRD